MPEYAIAHDHVRAMLPVDKIGDALVLLARGGVVPIGASDNAVHLAARTEGRLRG
jgi:hypothetical protein